MNNPLEFSTLSVSPLPGPRTQLFLDYEEELNRLQEYIDMYRKSSRTKLLPQDSIDFVTTVLDQSESLTQLNRSLIPSEPAYTSVYTKTTSSGNPRPTLTAYDLKRFHGFRNHVTDLVVLESIRDVHAVLLSFAEYESAEAFAHAAFGIEFGAPYIQTTEKKDNKEFYVIHFLFNDETMLLPSVQETYSFVIRFQQAYPDLPHIHIDISTQNICRIYLEKSLILKTAEAYKNGRPMPTTASSGFSLLGNFAFHQEGWVSMPPQFASEEHIIATLEQMQLDMVPTYNRLLKDGLEVLQDDRSFLSQIQLVNLREAVEGIIWDDIFVHFAKGSQEFEKITSLLLLKKQLDYKTLALIKKAKAHHEQAKKQIPFIRTQFAKIVPRISGLRSLAPGIEYEQSIKELEQSYSLLSEDANGMIKFILNLNEFNAKMSLQTLPRVVGFYGMLKIIVTVFSQYALLKNSKDETCYIHTRFSPTTRVKEGYLEVLMYVKGSELSKELLRELNNPLQKNLSEQFADEAGLKRLQEILNHVFKVDFSGVDSDEETTEKDDLIEQSQFFYKVGNLSKRTDGLASTKGFYIELHLPAFGRVEDLRKA